MKIILLEDTLYRVTDKDYKLIRKTNEQIFGGGYYHGREVDMNNFLDSIKHRFKEIGIINFDFRL